MTPPRFILLAIFLVSSAAIAYEILLMRLLSIVQWHHFAYMIISLALLGYGASGTFIAVARRSLEPRFSLAVATSALLFGMSMVFCFAVGQRVPFNALEIVWDPKQLVYLAAVYLIFFVPFFFAATCIGLALSCLRQHVSRVYLCDLVGAGTGAFGLIALLFVMPPQSALKTLALLALTASMTLGTSVARPARKRLMIAQGACLAVLLLFLPPGWPEFRISPFKGLSQALQVMDSRVLAEHSTPLGLVTVVESPTVPFRDAPGLSLNTDAEPPEQLGVFTDGDAMSVITRYDGNRDSLAYMDDMTAALPYRVLSSPSVLVLGAGGGSDVLMALYHGARQVEAVELNPVLIRLVAETYNEFAGGIYLDPRVAVHRAEARGFVRAGRKQYDLIQIALLDSPTAAISGIQSLNESYLYTVEAIGEYLRHLAPNGLIAITRWLRVPPRDSLKLLATAATALKRAGVVAGPDKQIALIRSWNTTTLLIGKRAFSAGEIASIRDFCRTRSFDTAWYPSMPAQEANRYNVLAEPYLYDGANALFGAEADDFIERYKFDIEPATDQRPYFFHFFKWGALREVLDLRKQGGAGLIDWGYLILVGTLAQAVVAGAVLILLPLALSKRAWPRGTGPRMGGYFLLLGLAFLFVEMAFIQKLILFLSHPLYSVAVVLSGFLVFAGIGSGLSRRLRMPVSIVVAVIAAIAITYLFALPVIMDRLAGLPDLFKIAVSLAVIAPLALFMGMPFPTGLTQLAASAPDFIPWAWALNGFASVASASLATMLAVEFGFDRVVATAVALYLWAAILIKKESQETVITH